MHRDLKPENIFIDESNLQIKIGDFGVAKEIPKYKNIPLTDYVCTRWYRAPECVLKGVNYNYSIDVWAVGCIMIELYNLNPIFPGIDEFDQLNKICNVLGTPNFNEWPEGYKLIQKLGMKFPICNKANLMNIVNDASEDAITLINDIFQYDSNRRPNCRQLLNYAYFSEFRPNTFSYGNRYNSSTNVRSEQKFDDNFMNNDNRGNNFLNNNFSPTNKGNFSVYEKNFMRDDVAKNNRDYINNLNYRNYLNHGSVIPDLNSIFGISQYNSVNNMENNNNSSNSNNNIFNGVYNQYNYNRNKFSNQNNMYGSRKKYSNNFYNRFNNNFFNNFGDNNYNNYKSNFPNRPSLGSIYNF
jgi:serine/threonine protein kinase